MTPARPTFPRVYRDAGTSFAFWVIYQELGWYGGSAWYTVLYWPAAARTPDPAPLYSGSSLHDARCAVTGCASGCLAPCPDDHPSIVETWI